METIDLYTEELEQLAPLRCGCGADITPELISEWAVEIGRKAFESDESMSGGEG